MTVAELIENLKQYPGHAQVCVVARNTEFDYVEDFEYLTQESGATDQDTLLVNVEER